jgi:hypothetical protein
VIACGWSLWESRQYVAAGRERTASNEITERNLRPENRPTMNHAYGLFAALPAYFSRIYSQSIPLHSRGSGLT